ncbi:sugar phosphate isomerase/epimerase family protein [Novosphingobium bradum]|uniref:Sugar phosphate isomerase/epimerase family protein n=1 Tax=Novosphingobium bradum TaxID=1737444 RepID=A0ABV7IV65_9SPHN
MKGPAVFLAQFASDEAPFNSLDAITRYMGGLGYKGVQIPTWDSRLFDLERCAQSQDYADEIKGVCAANGVEVTELSTHLQGQLVASHPAYDRLFDGFAPAALHGNIPARTEWAVEQVKLAALASRRLGCTAHATFSGALLWHTVYPWPQRPAGLVEEGFAELARRWTPILNVFEDNGIDAAFELHPGEDLHDGVTFERFLEAVGNHPRANILYDPSHFLLQQLDYLAFIDIYHERIKAFHVKDAEFRPNGRAGVYGSYAGWGDRPGRFRSLGDGQIDFTGIFTGLTHHGYDGWAVLEWECAYKHPEQGAAEGAPFIARHMIRKADKAFDDFAGTGTDMALVREVLGLDSAG